MTGETVDRISTGLMVTISAFVFTVMSTICGLAYGLGKQSGRIDNIEQRIQAMQAFPDRMARLEIITDETNKNVTEIKSTIRDMQKEARTK